MSTPEIITLITNSAVIIFLIWSYFRRKNIDERIDKLANILMVATDILDKNRSWEKTAKEIKSLEEVYERKSKATIDTHSKENLEAAKSIKSSEIDACYELELMESAIELLVPNQIKSLIHAQMLRQGTGAKERHAAIFFTSEKEVSEALLLLADAEISANEANSADAKSSLAD